MKLYSKSTFKKILRIGGIAVLFGWLVSILVTQSNQLDWTRFGARPDLFFLALICCLISVVGQFIVWIFLINRDSRVLGLVEGYGLYVISAMSRYLPAGKVLQFAAFAHFSESNSIRLRTTFALVISILCGLMAGALLTAVGVIWVFPEIRLWLPLAAIGTMLAGMTLISSPLIWKTILNVARKRFPQLPNQQPVTKTTIFMSTVLHTLLCWIPEGISLLILLWMIAPDHSSSAFWTLIAADAVAALAGYFAFFAPAGMGVKEGLFVVLLKTRIPVVEAVFLVLGSRVLFVIADLVFSVPFVLLHFNRGLKKTEITPQLDVLWDLESSKYSHRQITAENSLLKPTFLPVAGDAVLDAGCGAGTYLKYFSSITDNVNGIDISPKMVEAAGPACTIGDITQLEFENGRFSYILCFLAANHCGNSDAAFSEFSRVLRSGGRAVLVLPNLNSAIAVERKFMMAVGRYSLGECEHFTLKQLGARLQRVGLKIDAHYTITRKPECSTLLRQLFALTAYGIDRTLNLFFHQWGECWVIQARKI